MDEMDDPSESMDQEDIEIRALRMRAMESNADEDVSYIVDADALNNAQNHDTLMSDGHDGTLAIVDGLVTPAESNNALIPIADTHENILQTALLVNKDYQDLLQNQMNYIVAEIEKNKELQKKYKAILEKNSRPQRRAPVNNIGKRAPGFPYFTDQDGQKPPDNSDITDLKPEFEKTAYAFKFRKWSKQEIQALTQNVRKQNSDSRFQSLIEDLEANRISTEDFAVMSDILHNTPDAEFEAASVEDVRWDEIASNIGNRTAADCKMTWINSESPRINKNPWTKDEDNTLVKLVKKYKGFRWETIANELNTQRVAVQCIRRYQRNLNTGIMKTTWSADEDRQLAEAVKKFGESNWQQVANSLEGRTGQQCLHRWDKTLKPTIKKGRWNAEEDKMLIDAVNQIGEGKGWIKVSKLVPGRTDMQCRERWVNVLNPNLNHTPWSAEEDELLSQGIAIHGLGVWTKIAQVVVTRTDNQCWRRWKSINPTAIMDEYREAIGKKKAPSRRKAKKEKPPENPEDVTVEQQIKRMTKRRKTDFKNARKGNKALNDGIQSAHEPDEPIRVVIEQPDPTTTNSTSPSASASTLMPPPPNTFYSIAVDPTAKRTRGRPAGSKTNKNSDASRSIPSVSSSTSSVSAAEEIQSQLQESQATNQKIQQQVSMQQVQLNQMREELQQGPLLVGSSSSPPASPTSSDETRPVPISSRRKNKRVSAAPQSENEEQEQEGEEEEDDDNGRYDASTSTLPVVFPSAPVFTALHRLLQGMDILGNTTGVLGRNNSETHSDVFEALAPYTQLPEFKLLAAYFNSLFFAALLVVHETKSKSGE